MERIKQLFQPQTNFATKDDVRRRTGIKIKCDRCWTVNRWGFVQEGMKLQVGQICSPNKGRKIIDHAIINFSSLGFGDLGCLYPRRTMSRTFFFVKEESLHAIRISFECNR